MDELTFYFYAPIMGWLLLITLLFVLSVAKYTLGKWTPENPNPYAKETLGLPRGIFRAILTMSLLYAAIVFELLLLVKEGIGEGDMSEFMVAFQMMIAFYFGSKVMHHVTSNDRKKAEDHRIEAIEVAKATSPNYPLPPAMAKAQAGTSPAAPAADDFYDHESEG
jgi:hypothetical protein